MTINTNAAEAAAKKDRGMNWRRVDWLYVVPVFLATVILGLVIYWM